MSRLAFVIFFFFFIVLGYMAYLSQMALEESRISQEQLKNLALKLAGDSTKSVAVPPDPGMTALAQKELAAVEQKLSKTPGGDRHGAAVFLVNRARLTLEPLIAGGLSDSEALPKIFGYLAAARTYLAAPPEPLKVEPQSKDQGLIQKSYRVNRGDTLWAISKKLYNTPWRWHDIWKLNEAKLPVYKRMPSGLTLKLPG